MISPNKEILKVFSKSLTADAVKVILAAVTEDTALDVEGKK